jgi:hypothetical protein
MNLMELVVFEIYALTTQLDFSHNCQKNENVTTLTSEKLISPPDREKKLLYAKFLVALRVVLRDKQIS